MKIIYNKKRLRYSSLFLIFSFFLSAYRGLNAPVPTLNYVATAYPTLTPIVSTTTPIPVGATVDFSCPVGLPVGWGTVTPSTDWEMACGQCGPTGTPVDLSTSTPGATHTPVYNWSTPLPPVCITPEGGGAETCNTPLPDSSTATPTVTPIVNPTATLNGWDGGGYWDVFYADEVIYTHDEYDAHLSNPQNVLGVPDGAYSVCDKSSGYLGYCGLHVSFPVDFVGSSLRAVHVISEPRSNPGGVWNVFLNHNGSWVVSQSLREFLSYEPFEFLDLDFQYDYGVQYVDSIYVEVYVTGTPTPTPVVTSTSIPVTPSSSFCGSVSDENVPDQFELGDGTEIVWQECMSTPSLSYSDIIDFIFPDWLPSGFAGYFITIFPSVYIIDPLTVCTRAHDYSLYIFGIRMPMEFIFGVVIYLSAFRFFVPSVFSGASVIGRSSNPHQNDKG